MGTEFARRLLHPAIADEMRNDGHRAVSLPLPANCEAHLRHEILPRHNTLDGAHRTACSNAHQPPAARRRRLSSGAESLTTVLSLAGYDAQCVLDGSAALLAVAAQMPDIVVLDINMPGMDGYTVARILRHDVTAQHLVIVAFTAQDERTVRSDGVAAGFDAYCQKGAAPGPLLQLLEQIQ